MFTKFKQDYVAVTRHKFTSKDDSYSLRKQDFLASLIILLLSGGFAYILGIFDSFIPTMFLLGIVSIQIYIVIRVSHELSYREKTNNMDYIVLNAVMLDILSFIGFVIFTIAVLFLIIFPMIIPSALTVILFIIFGILMLMISGLEIWCFPGYISKIGLHRYPHFKRTLSILASTAGVVIFLVALLQILQILNPIYFIIVFYIILITILFFKNAYPIPNHIQNFLNQISVLVIITIVILNLYSGYYSRLINYNNYPFMGYQVTTSDFIDIKNLEIPSNRDLRTLYFDDQYYIVQIRYDITAESVLIYNRQLELLNSFPLEEYCKVYKFDEEIYFAFRDSSLEITDGLENLNSQISMYRLTSEYEIEKVASFNSFNLANIFYKDGIWYEFRIEDFLNNRYEIYQKSGVSGGYGTLVEAEEAFKLFYIDGHRTIFSGTENFALLENINNVPEDEDFYEEFKIISSYNGWVLIHYEDSVIIVSAENYLQAMKDLDPSVFVTATNVNFRDDYINFNLEYADESIYILNYIVDDYNNDSSQNIRISSKYSVDGTLLTEVVGNYIYFNAAADSAYLTDEHLVVSLDNTNYADISMIQMIDGNADDQYDTYFDGILDNGDFSYGTYLIYTNYYKATILICYLTVIPMVFTGFNIPKFTWKR